MADPVVTHPEINASDSNKPGISQIHSQFSGILFLSITLPPCPSLFERVGLRRWFHAREPTHESILWLSIPHAALAATTQGHGEVIGASRVNFKNIRIMRQKRLKDFHASCEKSDSIQLVKLSFRTGGIGEQEIIYMDLYPNLWVLVNRLELPKTGDI